jgi:hypothetical protein
VPHPPKAFVSYSWENDEHKAWVRALSERLRTDGVNVTLDLWSAAPGDQLPAFMERAIRENDFVLVVCTPTYREKSNRRSGGVGYEGDIMTGASFVSADHRKFIPVLRRGPWREAAPTWAAGKYYVDLSAEPYSESAYADLLSTLLGTRPAPPPVGGGKAGGYRRVYYESFDSDHLGEDEIRDRFGSIWLTRTEGPWKGTVRGGVYVVENRDGAGRPLYNRLSYSEGNDASHDLGRSRVGVRVRVEPPNDAHSGAGLMFRSDPESRSHYSLLRMAGDSISVALTLDGHLSFLESATVPRGRRGELIDLEISGSETGIDFLVDGRVVYREPDPELASGDVGVMALSTGVFTFDEFALFLRVE